MLTHKIHIIHTNSTGNGMSYYWVSLYINYSLWNVVLVDMTFQFTGLAVLAWESCNDVYI